MSDILQRLAGALEGRYRLDRELGAGGMATVYLAHDVKHERDVAIKVLHPDLGAALGGERFLTEIRTTARLQHPHILPLLDSGSADGLLYYVMPLVTGETLRARLERERQLPIADAVRIAREVASALDYAHRQNVIHRDIKPENILLHDGSALVADFGIALAVQSAGGQRMTQTGLSLGTPQYMSPEQAMGERTIDARSDIYALGAVTYEMLTGDAPFTGSSVQAIVAKVLSSEPERLSVVRKTIPSHLEGAVLKALAKLPADRFDSAKAFSDALVNPAFADAATHGPSRHTTAGAAPRSAAARWGMIGWAVGVAGLALAAWSWRGTGRAGEEQGAATYVNLALADSTALATVDPLGSQVSGISLSADGRLLVYAATTGSGTKLFRRDLGDFKATPIAGTDSAYAPMLSPDNRWVAFFVGNELRKVPIDGGSAVTLATVPESQGTAWGRDGRILVVAREGDLLGWIPESGGSITPIPNPSQAVFAWPLILADGQHALVSAAGPQFPGGIYIVDLVSGRLEAVTLSGPIAADSLGSAMPIAGDHPRVLSSGYLVYATPGGLMAVAFDPTTRRVRGRPIEVLSGVAHYAIADNGTLVYEPGADTQRGALVWVTPDGAIDSLGFDAQRYGTFSLSPDGRRLAAIVASIDRANELWVYDLQQHTQMKVRTEGFVSNPIWWPDSRRLVFSEIANRPRAPMMAIRQVVESAGERDTLGVGWELSSIARDTLTAVGGKGWGEGAWIFPLQKGQPPVSLDSFPTAWGPMISPDGRWIAYTSNEAGKYEIYVAASARRGERRKVSVGFGEEPLWSPSGDRLFYRAGSQWFSVPAPTGALTDFGRAVPVFRGPYLNVTGPSHDIARDGRRHLVLLGPPERPVTSLNVIQNWVVEVRAKVAAQDKARP